MRIRYAAPCTILVLLAASANAQRITHLGSHIPDESSVAYLNISGHNTNAVDANGVRYQGNDHAGNRLWLNDCVQSVAPDYPYSARVNQFQGRGVIRLTLNLRTGLVEKATLIKSTGFDILDACAISAFQQWAWKPGRWKEIDVPVTFQLGDIHAPLPAGMVRLPRS